MATTQLGLSCPRGGDFYVCTGSKVEFLGCCASNPCADGSGKCPTKDLRISSFNPDRYASIPAQGCDDARPANETFYTCKNSISFIGCCASNPCQENDGLCPVDNLLPTKLASDASSRAIFVGSSDTPSPSGTSGGGSSGGGLPTGAIVGIAVGAVVAVGIIIAIVWRCGWHARKRNERREPTWEPAAQSGHPEMGFVAPPHSPAPYDPARSPVPYDPSGSPVPYNNRAASYATTAVPGSYGSASPPPPHSPYYGMKHPHSPSIDERHLSMYTDTNTNVSSLSGLGSRHPTPFGVTTDLQPVSELDSTATTAPQAPIAELGDGTPVKK
ncbi:hypothetical protein CPLU01_08900 [Colletotrichum plurivorum]|uniref:Uncharacterized protein n=1 Tax=Colletotrichum plurivorum TaxID=2175906 RepID=A0A8H6KBP1_9PEZI|nr:hypothetical protein CPLU01_08900 [Colletotrichum plurivorum]